MTDYQPLIAGLLTIGFVYWIFSPLWAKDDE